MVLFANKTVEIFRGISQRDDENENVNIATGFDNSICIG